MIVPVYGNPCDMNSILDICERHNLTLIEDTCESLGASYDDMPLGTFGRVGTFSFYFSHHITTLEGGVCITNDFDLAETMRILRAHGWVRETKKPEINTGRRNSEINKRGRREYEKKFINILTSLLVILQN